MANSQEQTARSGCTPIIVILGIILLVAIGSRLIENAQTTPGTSAPQTAGTGTPQVDCSQHAAAHNFSSLRDGTVLQSSTGAEVAPAEGGSAEENMGTLTIVNGTANDAVVELVYSSSSNIAFKVYIAADSEYTISVASGQYNLLFALGEDWDNKGMQFRACQSYEKFDDSFTFDTANGLNGYRVTLNPVAGGNASASDINQSEFTNP